MRLENVEVLVNSYSSADEHKSSNRKAHEKFRRKRSVGVFRDCPHFWGTPYYL